jgi:hypothetical protein
VGTPRVPSSDRSAGGLISEGAVAERTVSRGTSVPDALGAVWLPPELPALGSLDLSRERKRGVEPPSVTAEWREREGELSIEERSDIGHGRKSLIA